jgi:hypothetical protein
MKRSESIAKIAAALISFSGQVGRIAKDASNPFHKNTYATLDQIIEQVRPILSENKLVISQDVSAENEYVTVSTFLLHESGEWLESSGTTLRLAKNDPQGAGAGITYARRYDLCAFLSLNTGEDDDGNSSSNVGAQNKGRGSQSNGSTGSKKASDKQLDTVNSLLKKKVSDKFNEQQLYDLLKERIKTDKEMKDWTVDEASRAIKFLTSNSAA